MQNYTLCICIRTASSPSQRTQYRYLISIERCCNVYHPSIPFIRCLLSDDFFCGTVNAQRAFIGIFVMFVIWWFRCDLKRSWLFLPPIKFIHLLHHLYKIFGLSRNYESNWLLDIILLLLRFDFARATLCSPTKRINISGLPDARFIVVDMLGPPTIHINDGNCKIANSFPKNAEQRQKLEIVLLNAIISNHPDCTDDFNC